ncbi:hypothetical protein [Mesorhizobium muleiense]|uniref:hypothetical protein n=1 Tax=Mesorhizobium muleiense TaxID=1004279 RepID=UPI001F316395|nr:hypothetical protein [Mesorhizobium muleiense]
MAELMPAVSDFITVLGIAGRTVEQQEPEEHSAAPERSARTSENDGYRYKVGTARRRPG